MSRTLLKRPAALADLESIARQIASENLSAALRLVSEFDETTGLLLEFPYIGPKLGLPGRLSDYRRWPIRRFRHYLIIYRATKTQVEIARVIHGARNLPAWLTDLDNDSSRG